MRLKTALPRVSASLPTLPLCVYSAVNSKWQAGRQAGRQATIHVSCRKPCHHYKTPGSPNQWALLRLKTVISSLFLSTALEGFQIEVSVDTLPAFQLSGRVAHVRLSRILHLRAPPDFVLSLVLSHSSRAAAGLALAQAWPGCLLPVVAGRSGTGGPSWLVGTSITRAIKQAAHAVRARLSTVPCLAGCPFLSLRPDPFPRRDPASSRGCRAG